MPTLLLYIGIAIIVIGWLSLSWFAIKQVKAQKEYANLPQKWEEVKHNLVRKRWICRSIIIVGIILLIVSTILQS